MAMGLHGNPMTTPRHAQGRSVAFQRQSRENLGPDTAMAGSYPHGRPMTVMYAHGNAICSYGTGVALARQFQQRCTYATCSMPEKKVRLPPAQNDTS